MLKRAHLYKKATISLFGIFIFSPLFIISPTSATSVYDNSYRTTNNLVLEKDMWCPNMPDTQNYITTYTSYLLDEAKWHWQDQANPSGTLKPFKDSFLAALSDTENGTWGVSKVDDSTYGTHSIMIFWTQDPNVSLQWGHVSTADWVTLSPVNYVELRCNHASFGTQYDHFFGVGLRTMGGGPSISQTAPFYPQSVRNLFVHSPNQNFANYPVGYEGEQIQMYLSDLDGDGLSMAKEVTQGTSDALEDTDEDGISDLRESVWYEGRDDIFCGSSQCAYPNPSKKDIYVEIDWMDDGVTGYKPTSTQLESIASAFEAKNISFHADTGQYGGGNELPVYISELKFVPEAGETDFFNLKNGDENYGANFSENRRGIWRYHIAGYKQNVNGSNTSTGVAYTGDDDAFIAVGRVKELNPTNQDSAIAGTIIHELGHNLCLSNDTYNGQDPSCLFSGVDNAAGNDYVSSMNYDKQFLLVNYSNGFNGANDHDDWSAVMVGMDDFVTLGEDPTENSLRRDPVFDKLPQY